MTVCAIHARYSSDLQRDVSVEDQVRVCRRRIERQGWSPGPVYSDRAISGASHLRPGFQAMLEAARAGGFDVLLAESLDRLSRDQEHVAGLFKTLSYHGVPLITLSEGEITDIVETTRARIAVARLQGDDPPLIGDLARDPGCSHNAALTRAVRRWTGRTPSDIRRGGAGRRDAP